jgi:hypothetical protein
VESELNNDLSSTRSDDFLEGVRAGVRAEKRSALERLHWIIDPDTEAVDIERAGPLIARLNEREVIPEE